MKNNLSFRTCSIELGENQVRTAIAATEAAVPMPDYARGVLIPEVLLMSGAKFKSSVPLLDCHQRNTIDNTKGKAVNLRVEGDKLLCDLEISQAEESTQIKVDDKTITDLSVGYTIFKRVVVEKGQTKGIGGRTWTGPISVVTSWRIDEISLTPIGADSAAKIRSSNIDTDEDIFGNGAENEEPPHQRRNMEKENKIEETRTAPQVDVNAEIEKQVAQRAKEIENKFKEKEAVRKLCAQHGMEDISETCESLNEARAKVLDYLAGRTKEAKVNISFGESEKEKKSEAIGYAIAQRALVSFSKDTQKEFLGDEVKGWQNFRGVSLLHLAEDDLEQAGVQTRYMAPQEIAERALRMGAVRDASEGYYTPGSLPYLMMDASNKTLGAAFAEAPSTFQIVSTQLPSAKDFKDLNYISLSEIGLLDAWDGVNTPSQANIGDGKEVLKVVSYAKNFTLPFATIVNDDLNALSRATALIGAAAKRTLNTRFWGIITDNGTMNDGYSIIDDTNHHNHAASAAPDSASFDIMYKLISSQTGSTGAPLGIVPRYVVSGPSVSQSIKRLVHSSYDFTQSNKFGATNIYDDLIAVNEPLISNSYWYMFAEKSTCETAVVSYLQGQETPKLVYSIDPKNLSQNILVTQASAMGVVNHRGIARNVYSGS